jgi:hypothetical protein
MIESFEAGKGSHNIHLGRDKRIHLCSSEESSVLVYDLTKKTVVDSHRIGDMYLRGMCRTRDGFLLGSSARRIRDKRLDKTPGYVSFHADDLSLLWRKKLPNVGQISDIRVTDEVDFCHNQIILEEPMNERIS